LHYIYLNLNGKEYERGFVKMGDGAGATAAAVVSATAAAAVLNALVRMATFNAAAVALCRSLFRRKAKGEGFVGLSPLLPVDVSGAGCAATTADGDASLGQLQ
jgi:prenyltransferase beta subunit